MGAFQQRNHPMTDPIPPRAMPFSDEAEKGILSCFMHTPSELLPDARGSIAPDCFYHPANRTLFEALLDMHAAEKPVEYVALAQYLQDKGLMEKIGGQGTLAELLDFVPAPTHYSYYKGIVQDKLLLRRVLSACAELTQQCYEYQEDVLQVLTHAESKMFDILSSAKTRGLSGSSAIPAKEAVMQWMEHLQIQIDNRGHITGLSTGLADVDRTFWGIDDKEGEIFTLGGRPGAGKTAGGVTLAENLGCVQQIPGAIFTQEMSINQWLTRQVLGQGEIDTAKGLTAHFNRDELCRIIPGRVKTLSNAPIHFCGNPSLSTADLRQQVQLLKRRHGIRWIIVDHLHLVKPVGETATKDERIRLVETMETLQFLKKEFKLGIILLVQLSRETDRNKGALPVLADLSGSAAIEQFSDQVVFIHRPVYHTEWRDLDEKKQERFLNAIQKQREANPTYWADGRKHESEYSDDGKHMKHLSADEQKAQWMSWRNRQDWEEHALWVVRKNRRGPTPEIFMRFQAEFTRFTSRTKELFSNNEANRQVRA